MTLDDKVKKIINSDIILQIGNIKIVPREDDLPNHYIKGNTIKEENDRKQTIVDIKKNILHIKNHSCCSKEFFVHRNKGRIVLDIGCKKARYILKRKSKNSNDYFLVSGFKIRKRQFIKVRQQGNITEIKTEEELINFLE